MLLEYVYGTHFTQPTTTMAIIENENMGVNRKLLFSLPIAIMSCDESEREVGGKYGAVSKQ